MHIQFLNVIKTCDCHNMNTENDEKWFKEQLIANLEEPSLKIIITTHA